MENAKTLFSAVGEVELAYLQCNGPISWGRSK